MKHVMVDLETMGLKHNTQILTVGAVAFDPFATDLYDKVYTQDGQAEINLDAVINAHPDFFYRRVDKDSYKLPGIFTTDKSTEQWWENQNDQARYEAKDAPDRVLLDQALMDFRKWFPGNHVWSHGSTFDVIILNHAMGYYNITTPWTYSKVRDTRTLYKFTGVQVPTFARKHHALYDAFYQAVAVQAAYKKRVS